PPFEPCDKRPAKVSSTALVRYRMNDYSLPTAYGFRDVLVKGFVDEVAIVCGADEIARHSRIIAASLSSIRSIIWHSSSKSPVRSTRRRPCRTGHFRNRSSIRGGCSNPAWAI